MEKLLLNKLSILERRFAIIKIRKDLLIDHKEYMRLRNDQEWAKFTKQLKSYWKIAN